MSTSSVSITDTLYIAREDGTSIVGSLDPGRVDVILKRSVALYNAGFLKFIASDEDIRGSTKRFDIPILATVETKSDSSLGQKLKAAPVYLKLDRYEQIKVETEHYDQLLFNKFGALKGEVFAARMVQAMKIEAATFFAKLAASAKAAKADANLPDPITILADDDVGENDRTALMASKCEDVINLIRGLHDNFTLGVENDFIIGFVKKEVFKKLRYGIAGQGHVITDIKTENEISSIKVNGITIFEDLLLGKNWTAGILHKTKAYDLSKVSAVFLTRNSSYQFAGKFFISELLKPGATKTVSLMTWVAGNQFAKEYTLRNRLITSSDL